MSSKLTRRMACLAFSGAAGISAQTGPQNEDNFKALIDAARKDLRTEKQAIIDQAMQLDAGEKAKFWGIYAGFQKELDAIWDVRFANVKKYADSFQSMSDSVADEIAGSALNNEGQMTALKKKYHPKFKSALGAKNAARWLQVETALGNLAMLQLLSEVPLLK